MVCIRKTPMCPAAGRTLLFGFMRAGRVQRGFVGITRHSAFVKTMAGHGYVRFVGFDDHYFARGVSFPGTASFLGDELKLRDKINGAGKEGEIGEGQGARPARNVAW